MGGGMDVMDANTDRSYGWMIISLIEQPDSTHHAPHNYPIAIPPQWQLQCRDGPLGLVLYITLGYGERHPLWFVCMDGRMAGWTDGK